MADNLIQIKRSETTANPTSLANGELAWTGNGSVLFIGNNNAVVAIAGARSPGTLTANQALVANSTSGIDRIIVANAIVTTITANGSVGTAGQILTSNGTTSHWANPANSSFTIAGDSGTDVVSTGQTLTFASANGLTTAVTDNQVTFSVDTGSSLTVNATGIHVNSTNLSIATSQLTGDVALGTNTSGNYVATITAGAGISGSSSSEGGTPTIAVVAGSGVASNATGVHVVAGAGIASNATGVHVVAGNTTVVSNTTGVYVNAAALSIATSQLSGDVALGTNTSGNYVATITAGAGISGSSAAEGGTPTIAVVAGSGVASNSTGVHVVAGSGVASNSTGVHVVAGTNGGLVSNSTGVFVNAGSGLLSNATGLHVGTANGITVAADAVGVLAGSTLTVNATGVHVNSALSITDLSLSGNLTVQGTLTTVDTVNLTIKDSMIELANGNVSTDSIDIGFYGQYGETGAKFTGMFRDASDSGIYKLYSGLTVEPTTTVDTANTSYTQGTLQAFLRSGGLVSNSTAVTLTANSTLAVNLTANSMTLTTPLAATSGGTGINTYAAGDLIVATGVNTLSKLAIAASGRVLMSNGTAIIYDTLDGGTF